jgi:formamidopyrimidine-DNA glycosylase
MPEGPEVRTVADKIRPYLLNTTLIGFHYDNRAKGTGFNTLTMPCAINNVSAYGKKVVMTLVNGDNIIISLGMTGRLQFTAGKHSHVAMTFNNGQQTFFLYFDDPRMFGGIEILLAPQVSNYFAGLGPDLLQCALDTHTWISSEQWLQCFKTVRPSTKAICNMLEDQHRVAGLGWYLITEVLYYSGILPERETRTITFDEWERMRINAHKIIYLSYSYGGFTIKDYISPDGKRGCYPAAIYGKEQDPLGNFIIHKPFKSGRTIHYVPAIQH